VVKSLVLTTLVAAVLADPLSAPELGIMLVGNAPHSSQGAISGATVSS